MIGAFDAVVWLDLAGRQRHAAMGADIADRERRAVLHAAQRVGHVLPAGPKPAPTVTVTVTPQPSPSLAGVPSAPGG